MNNPFVNDPFAMVWKAFKNLYPNKDCECLFDVIEKNEQGDEVFGVTYFDDDGSITVVVDCTLTLANATEIFAHELAHVAVGDDAGHGEEWEKAFDDIFSEYNRIGYEMFDKHTPTEVIDAKSCHY